MTSDDANALKKEGILVTKMKERVYHYSRREGLIPSLESVGSVNCSHCSCRNTNIDRHLAHGNWSHSGRSSKCCPLCPIQSSYFRTCRDHEATHALEALVHCVHCRRYWTNKAALEANNPPSVEGCNVFHIARTVTTFFSA